MSGGFGCFFGINCCNTSEVVPMAPRDFTMILDSRTNEELGKRYMQTTRPTVMAVRRFMTDILRRLGCDEQVTKTVCILALVYLERMLAAYESVTLQDFMEIKSERPSVSTTKSYASSPDQFTKPKRKQPITKG